MEGSTHVHRKALIASAIAALATVVLLRAYLHRFELESNGGPLQRVVVLARDLEPGATLDHATLATRELPASYVESRHVGGHELDRMVGLTLAVPGRATETLLWTDLTALRRGSPRLSSLVPEGMRAMTLTPRAGSNDALLEPGDRVDVLSTRSPKAADGAPRTHVVAEAVLVLAVGDRSSAARSAGGSGRGGAITVAVTPEQGRTLAEAEVTTALRLVLRNADELALAPDAPRASAAHALPSQHDGSARPDADTNADDQE